MVWQLLGQNHIEAILKKRVDGVMKEMVEIQSILEVARLQRTISPLVTPKEDWEVNQTARYGK